jgi:molecular chaperone DnaK (HSP70)
MRLGIDFGTTRIVVAAVDRGNYPVAQFETPDGVTADWFPPLIAIRGEERRYGWDAWSLQSEPGWTIVRSLKRLLRNAGPATEVEIAEQSLPMQLLLDELTAQLRTELVERSTLSGGPDEQLEIYLGVPANANSNQRFLEVEAFRRSGFEVLGLLNEPSAASIEFSHYHRASNGKTDGALLVYDLGGGTFDASVVELGEKSHVVLGSEGIVTLGGDDFDEILAEVALAQAGAADQEQDSLTQAELFRLHDECRQKKETLNPNSRKIGVDLSCAREGWGEVSVSVADYYEACRPLVEETLHAVEYLLERHSLTAGDAGSGRQQADRIEAVYVAGGGSELPLVPRMLRDRFGRRVRRSTHARTTTAIGLAIQADASAGYHVRDRFTRYFGVWREADGGSRIAFDPLFSKEEALPAAGEGPLSIERRYSPVHNIGHFRYLESSHITPDGQPSGDITFWDEIRFPFDPSLEDSAELGRLSVHLSEEASHQAVQEAYSCDAGGVLTLTITNQTDGHSRRFQLGQWAGTNKPLRPGREARHKVRAATKSPR